MKKCYRCAEVKPLSEFHRSVRRYDGVQSRCKTCENTLRRARYGSSTVHEIAQRNDNRLKGYGLTTESFDGLLAAQGGMCAVCSTTNPGGKGRFHVDHDHGCCPRGGSCGRCVRGLLCHSCNLRLGIVENAEWMVLANRYLAQRVAA